MLFFSDVDVVDAAVWVTLTSLDKERMKKVFGFVYANDLLRQDVRDTSSKQTLNGTSNGCL